MNICLVAGTDAWHPDADPRSEWWRPESPFAEFLIARGHTIIGRADGRPFCWSTALDGEPGETLHRDWRAAGIALFDYLVPPLAPEHRIPSEDLLVIAHSHGGQVALYAFAAGLRGALITVATPVRGDMEGIAEQARENVTWWRHIHSDHSDWWQVLGAIGDGRLGIYRKHPLADENVPVPGVGHSGVLCDLWEFHRWVDGRWLDAPATAGVV